ncbi:MAG: rnhB [Burkholderiaceae bacterium]|nr:rnhB [Burkholderiaceae bacterium]
MRAVKFDLFNDGITSPEQAQHLCGADEAGRGPLAGAVFAAAVILDVPIVGLADSKKLSAKTRERLSEQIKNEARAWCIASASVAEIDALNILQASMLAMTRAVQGLNIRPDWVWVDGNHFPKGLLVAQYAGGAMIQGDTKEPAISAASILAKVARDADCLRLHDLYPEYGFAQHKGYPTAAHLKALQQHGATPEHRMSFAPVKTLRFKTQKA